jgi:cobyrinic acid a,c-diamide synthase
MTARIVIAGTSSGAGKTTVASGLMAAFRARGRTLPGA